MLNWLKKVNAAEQPNKFVKKTDYDTKIEEMMRKAFGENSNWL